MPNVGRQSLHLVGISGKTETLKASSDVLRTLRSPGVRGRGTLEGIDLLKVRLSGDPSRSHATFKASVDPEASKIPYRQATPRKLKKPWLDCVWVLLGAFLPAGS